MLAEALTFIAFVHVLFAAMLACAVSALIWTRHAKQPVR